MKNLTTNVATNPVQSLLNGKIVNTNMRLLDEAMQPFSSSERKAALNLMCSLQPLGSEIKNNTSPYKTVNYSGYERRSYRNQMIGIAFLGNKILLVSNRPGVTPMLFTNEGKMALSNAVRTFRSYNNMMCSNFRFKVSDGTTGTLRDICKKNGYWCS